MRRTSQSLVVLLALLSSGTARVSLADDSAASKSPDALVQFVQGKGRVAVVIEGMPVALYVYEGEGVTRPFFCHVRTTSGVQVTRNHPPLAGHDLVDHDAMHQGIWMSFGDLDGHDYWRNKAHVQHIEFAEPPHQIPQGGAFAVRNHYLHASDRSQVVCHEVARYRFLARPYGYLILWESRFTADREFTFGDQEEMGLGVRVATALRVGNSGGGNLPPGAGEIRNSAGAEGEDKVWGKPAHWCSYSGVLAGQNVGLTLFAHPQNPRPSRYHVRGYGLLVANPFGVRAFDQGQESRVPVQPNEELRLRYGILIHGTAPDAGPNLAAAFSDYLKAAGK